ncbi:MAG TPA: translational GTPase TypA [bacterium]|nr:translational GTPase TypA [bacterium]HMZ04119.1 translational GTPase TypA [bacterium]HNB09287.1 translational GTPase TypA [bacterium]HNC48119.1 translational GTPase TypA [bacterium]HND76423.1 translational GTPase TypA [bacterium]
MKRRTDIRNVAIIAHVDHGKTTLVDQLLRQSGTFRENQQIAERVMDSNDLERERGITILAKNTSIRYKGAKINIVDTPGHADFGGEVERIMTMVDGVLLLVDAFDGPMPQTKFVLKKALASNCTPIVVINKIDRPGARPHEVLDEVFNLFLELNANDEQLDFATIYASAKMGFAQYEIDQANSDMVPLFDTILERIPSPPGEREAAFQMLVANIDYSDYLGRIAIGRIQRGEIKTGQNVAVMKKDGTRYNSRVVKLFAYEGLKRTETESAYSGEIVAMAGMEEIQIGETIADYNNPEALEPIHVDEPTIAMNFIVNNSPFAGQDGKFVTSRHLRERLYKELLSNLALRVEDTESMDTFKVSGRGELHLCILIENMRREGFEFQVSRPEVIMKRVDGQLLEPMEYLIIDVPEEYMGVVIEKLGKRKAEMKNLIHLDNKQVKIEFVIPARGLIGYRGEFLTDTRGTGVLNHIFHDYAPYKGDIGGRLNGVLISMEQTETVAYALFGLQERGELIVDPQTPVYEGMIIGKHSRENDLVVNVGKGKKLTNMRASGSDDAVRLEPVRPMSLEDYIEFINDDELVEITPKTFRLRKKVLKESDRRREERKKKD